MGRYVFDNSAEDETAVRFRVLASIYDPTTRRIVQALKAAGKGSRCLEVGGGGGSLVRWLSRRVGPQGRVQVTDIDPRFLTKALARLANVEIAQHDIANDELPTETFDFVHTRLVLEHVPEYEKGVDHLVGSLRPQGRILLEDFDLASLDWAAGSTSFGPPDATDQYRRLAVARSQIFGAHGVHREVGRRLATLLAERGVVGIGAEANVSLRRGGTVASELDRTNFRQLRSEILARGLFNEREFDEALKIFDDPRWSWLSPLMISAWGSKP
jgi:2-polyprenyl-3-methyl-5-hydroxy-6-metoxy-1,4-benzoquinol methylase